MARLRREARTIRIPVHVIETTNQIVRTSRQMLNEISREPTPEELAEKLGMRLEKVSKVLKIAKEPLSLKTPIGDEEDSRLGDFIEGKNAILPDQAAIATNLRDTTTRVLASLSQFGCMSGIIRRRISTLCTQSTRQTSRSTQAK